MSPWINKTYPWDENSDFIKTIREEKEHENDSCCSHFSADQSYSPHMINTLFDKNLAKNTATNVITHKQTQCAVI